jgi:AraC-like DNA-binding protein
MNKGIINPWRQIDDHELFMFDNGSAKMVVEDKEHTFESPWYVVMRPATRHISYCLSEAVDIYYCHFNWVYAEEFTSPTTVYAQRDGAIRRVAVAPGFVPRGLMCGKVASREALELHHRVVALFSSQDLRQHLLARSLFLQELCDVLGPKAPSHVHAGAMSVDPESIRQALTASAHLPFADAPSLADVLAGLGSSYYHLERLFRHRYNLTPHAYVSLIRVERAKELLRTTDMNVTACARTLGYRDVGYFIRFFRKQVGISPAAYRARERSPKAAPPPEPVA